MPKSETAFEKVVSEYGANVWLKEILLSASQEFPHGIRRAGLRRARLLERAGGNLHRLCGVYGLLVLRLSAAGFKFGFNAGLFLGLVGGARSTKL